MERLARYMQLSRGEVRVLQRAHRERVAAIMAKLGLEHSDLANRIFCVRDLAHNRRPSGACDLESFVVAVWNLCTSELRYLCFELYDVDDSGFLEMSELQALVVDASTIDGARSDRVVRLMQDLRTCVEESPHGALSKAQFDEFCAARPSLLAPAYQIRDRLRRVVGGERFWRRVEARRQARGTDKAGHVTTAFVVLRRIFAEKEPSQEKTDLDRHRVRKIKAKWIDAALLKRTVATATRGKVNPVAVAFQQRKYLAMDVVDELCDVATVVPEESSRDANNMQRAVSYEADTAHHAQVKAKVLEWTSMIDHVEDPTTMETLRRRRDDRRQHANVLRPDSRDGSAAPPPIAHQPAVQRWSNLKRRASAAHVRPREEQ